MADFCQQCSFELAGMDIGDLEGLCGTDEVVAVLCEGCGYINVDHEGKCVDPLCEKHGAK